MIHDLIEGKVAAHDGMVAIPDGPGLGFSVSDRVLKDHIKS
jgi:L-alanine-DL-glutamate epimerase-like enolase superfamily enzyme